MQNFKVTGGTKEEATNEARSQDYNFVFMYSEVDTDSKVKTYYFVA
jgi:hypothetical protein